MASEVLYLFKRRSYGRAEKWPFKIYSKIDKFMPVGQKCFLQCVKKVFVKFFLKLRFGFFKGLAWGSHDSVENFFLAYVKFVISCFINNHSGT